MENYLYYFCAYFLEAIILWQYCIAIFQPKRSLFMRFAFLFLLYTILSVIFALNLVSINALLFLLANFLFIYLMFDSGLLSATFHASLTTAIMGLSELVALNLFPNMAYTFYEPAYFQQNFIILTVFSKIIYFILLFTISHLLTKNKEIKQPNRKEILLILSIPILSVWIIVTLFIVCRELELPTFLSRMILISSFLLLIINIIIWIIYTYTQRKNWEFTNIQLQLQKELDTTEYYKMLLEEHENQQILIHDIKKHLQSLSLLNDQGQTEKITAYIQHIINSSDLQSSVRICDNEMLNAILCRYALQCKQLQITFHSDIRSGVIDFVGDDDLTSLFCNLLDNALEAARTYPESYIELNVIDRPNTALTVLTMVNSCRINPFDKNGKLISRKSDALHHGFGLKSIERIVKLYHGEMQLYYKTEDYAFHTIIILRKNAMDEE